MSPPALFAGLRVHNLEAGREWYERLFGEPSFFPNESEVVWTLAHDRSIYIKEDPESAGGGLVLVWVDDLDSVVRAIASRGLDPVLRETLSNGVRKATYHDPDGNEVGFGGAPLTD